MILTGALGKIDGKNCIAEKTTFVTFPIKRWREEVGKNEDQPMSEERTG